MNDNQELWKAREMALHEALQLATALTLSLKVFLRLCYANPHPHKFLRSREGNLNTREVSETVIHGRQDGPKVPVQ